MWNINDGMTATVEIENPCTRGKHFSPFKCDHVPADVCLMFIKRHERLCILIFLDGHMAWSAEQHRITRTTCRRSERIVVNKKYWRNENVLLFEKMVQEELNFAPATYKTQHIFHRFRRIYAKHIKMSSHVDWDKKEVRFYIDGNHHKTIKI